jgi:alpha-L-fucosidase
MKNTIHFASSGLILAAVITTLAPSAFAAAGNRPTDPASDITNRAAQVAAHRTPQEQAEHEARIAWWREAKFGLFIHWGLYAVPAGGRHARR